MIVRSMRRMALVAAALAPMACATEGAFPNAGTHRFDEPEEAIPAATGQPEDSSRPDAALPVERSSLQAQAEEAYRARRFADAAVLYDRLLALQPSDAHAWLRLGNIHHQRRDWLKALTAYRRASARTLAGVETEASLRAKAIYNVALVNLELSRQSLRSLEQLVEAGHVVADPAPLRRQIEHTQDRLEALSTGAMIDRPAPPPAPAAAPTGSTKAAASDAARAASARDGAAPPRVDYIRGLPKP
ncbi:MAG: tetratricopeptide repeat protein [Burkholderiaceae bacterium]|nr:tetratricopeptide repeat protein [Burkholderiaceae bacterium]